MNKASHIIHLNWDSLPVLSLENILWEPDCGVRAFAQICQTEDALHIHMRAIEKNIRAEYNVPLSPVHEDSCLEFFFMPENESRYLNFEMNPNGCLHIGFGFDRYSRVVIVRRDAERLFDIHASKTEDGWEIFYQIPFSFLRIFYPGFNANGALKANFYKCGDKTIHPHYLSWAPVGSETPDFHRPEFFVCSAVPSGCSCVF